MILLLIFKSFSSIPHIRTLITFRKALVDRDMKLQKLVSTVFCLSLLPFHAAAFTEFEITVPRDPVCGYNGQVLILPCMFPVDGSWDLSSTVITWQRGMDVVHSFYYSRDQLDRQHPLYAKRTSLFHREMSRGNASLKLDRVNLKDAGVYTCSISTNSGSQKKSFEINVAALYSEPRLQFSVLNDDGVNLLVTSHGGFPAPTLQWLMENSIDITNQTHTELTQDTHTGLYSVSSWINLTDVINSSLTFILNNKHLDQDIRREIQLYSDKREKKETEYRCHGCFALISGILLLLSIVTASVFVFIHNRRIRIKRKRPTENGFRTETKALNGKLSYCDQPNIQV